MNLITTCFFVLSYLVFKHNFLFIYAPHYETGGDLFPVIYGYMLTGLNFSISTMIGYFIIKEGWWQALLLLPLFVLVEFFRGRTKKIVQKMRFVGLDDSSVVVERSQDTNNFRQPEVYQGPFQPVE